MQKLRSLQSQYLSLLSQFAMQLLQVDSFFPVCIMVLENNASNSAKT
jgi:hypothetical protein